MIRTQVYFSDKDVTQSLRLILCILSFIAFLYNCHVLLKWI